MDAAATTGATVIATSRPVCTAVVRARANDGAAASAPNAPTTPAVLAAVLAAVFARANDGAIAVDACVATVDAAVVAAAVTVDGDVGASTTMDTVPSCDGGLGAAGRRGPPLAGALADAAPVVPFIPVTAIVVVAAARAGALVRVAFGFS